jgi:hypothetical protein
LVNGRFCCLFSGGLGMVRHGLILTLL